MCYLCYQVPPTRQYKRLLEYVKNTGLHERIFYKNFQQFASSNWDCDTIVMTAVKENGEALQYAYETHQSNREIVSMAVNTNGTALLYASTKLRADYDIVQMAIQNNGEALKYASTNLRNNENIVLEAIKQNSFAFKYASSRLKMDFQFVCQAIEQNGYVLRYCLYDFKKSRKSILIAMSKDGGALKYVSEEFQNDYDIVLAAVKQDGHSLKYASNRLKHNSYIITTALIQQKHAISHLPNNTFLIDGKLKTMIIDRLDRYSITIEVFISTFLYACMLGCTSSSSSIKHHITNEKEDVFIIFKGLSKYSLLSIKKEIAEYLGIHSRKTRKSLQQLIPYVQEKQDLALFDMQIERVKMDPDY
mmetsp:Transcript_37860/g.49023  ORF Transcript_37860/g.49023 Transcript_37860/m.49023 type:complete len:361 (-) Transcript_37860:57-1139(-)